MPYSHYGLLEHVLRPRRTLTLRLFSNDFTPTDDFVLSDFTEVSFPGYASIPLPPKDWIANTLILVFPKQTFILTEDLATSVSIYGYYLTDTDGVVLAERSPSAPHNLSVHYSRFDVTPTLKIATGA